MADLRYISTRGHAPVLGFEEVLLAGLARDGGLYVPERWPFADADAQRKLAGRKYAEVAYYLVGPFIGASIPDDELRRLVADSYGQFDHQAVAPLKQLGEQLWLLELFHGPTLAFKDYALQFVGRLFDYVLERRQRRATILVATSGDTGSAAIEACRDRRSLDIVVLHPHGRTSEVQRRQMTTVEAGNVHNIAIEGSFDDCQALVKGMFEDLAFRDELGLSAMNSINWARIAAQVVYYASAALALGAPHREIAFAVPTGNFGNVYAGYAARAMGFPITGFVVASNRNDVLSRFLQSGTMTPSAVEPSLSPSMDIQVPSNFERLLFDLAGRDGAAVAESMREFRRTERLSVGKSQFEQLRKVFCGASVDDKATLAAIQWTHAKTGEIVDPHTAVGLAAGASCWSRPDVPLIALACAHPAKFPDAVEAAIGIRPALPHRLADLFARRERFTVLPADLSRLKTFIRERARSAT